MTSPNLDFICADYGRLIGDNDLIEESLLNKAIGVLQENGVYALILFLSSRSSTEKEGAMYIKKKLLDLWYDPRLSICSGPRQDQFIAAQQISQNIDQLLFVKELSEKTLIYSRYHVKARG